MCRCATYWGTRLVIRYAARRRRSRGCLPFPPVETKPVDPSEQCPRDADRILFRRCAPETLLGSDGSRQGRGSLRRGREQAPEAKRRLEDALKPGGTDPYLADGGSSCGRGGLGVICALGTPGGGDGINCTRAERPVCLGAKRPWPAAVIELGIECYAHQPPQFKHSGCGMSIDSKSKFNG